jgi:hypothetical protein
MARTHLRNLCIHTSHNTSSTSTHPNTNSNNLSNSNNPPCLLDTTHPARATASANTLWPTRTRTWAANPRPTDPRQATTPTPAPQVACPCGGLPGVQVPIPEAGLKADPHSTRGAVRTWGAIPVRRPCAWAVWAWVVAWAAVCVLECQRIWEEAVE